MSVVKVQISFALPAQYADPMNDASTLSSTFCSTTGHLCPPELSRIEFGWMRPAPGHSDLVIQALEHYVFLRNFWLKIPSMNIVYVLRKS